MTFHLDLATVIILVALYLGGLVAAVVALFQSRTPQGAAAWIVSLISFPFLSLPLFIIFGKRRLKKYASFNVQSHYPVDLEALKQFEEDSPQDSLSRFFCNSEHPLLKGHRIQLLVDGRNIFPSMLADIERAEEYILLQMFLVRSDGIGKKFLTKLAEKASAGVKVYILIENIGVSVDDELMKLLTTSGVKIGKYNPTRKSLNQANFRNHKKLLVIDDKVGYWGGVNIGDDYLGMYEEIGYWRDTNIRLEGPALVMAKLHFAKDWEWSQDSRLEISWKTPKTAGDSEVFILNSDPSSDRAINLLQHIELINQSSKKLWIANPYLVPPQGLVDALIIARIRGVDVRILVPGTNDNPIVHKAAEVYIEKLLKAGVKIYKFKHGMMHQKVLISDNRIAMVGSSNFDFRSMYINFENGILSPDRTFVKEVEQMLEADFLRSNLLTKEEFRRKSYQDKMKAKFCNVLAPIL